MGDLFQICFKIVLNCLNRCITYELRNRPHFRVETYAYSVPQRRIANYWIYVGGHAKPGEFCRSE